MTATEATTRWDERLIKELEALAEREERAALAALRRGLGKEPGEAAEVFPHLIPLLPTTLGASAEGAAYLVAGLFALHPLSWPMAQGSGLTNLGASFRRLVTEESGESTEKRFVALLNCHRDDLPEHLRRAVALLKSHDVPVDWLRLFRDVRGWDSERRWVQRAWARAFWGTAVEEGGEPAAAS